jgi:hypothetical protein
MSVSGRKVTVSEQISRQLALHTGDLRKEKLVHGESMYRLR